MFRVQPLGATTTHATSMASVLIDKVKAFFAIVTSCTREFIVSEVRYVNMCTNKLQTGSTLKSITGTDTRLCRII